MMEYCYCKITSFPIFSLNIFNFFRTAILQTSYKLLLLIVRCFPSVLQRSFATNRNSEEQLLQKDASCMAITFNFIFNKMLLILALSFSLIDVTGFKFRFLKVISAQNVSSEAQIKIFFISQKNYVSFSRYSNFCIFNHSMIYRICDVMMDIIT